MKLLAFDCSTDTLSIAVFDGIKKLADETVTEGRHSVILAPAIERILKKTRLDFGQLDCIAPGLGPGSFTGLRVAVVTAKSLAYVSKTKLIGVSSLEAVARVCREKDRPIVVIADARKGMLYGAVFRRTGKTLRTLRRPVLVKIEKFFKDLKGPVYFTGGVEKFDAEIAQLTKKRTGISRDEHNSLPTADGVAEAARDLAVSGTSDDAFHLEPLYLHPRDCNVTKK